VKMSGTNHKGTVLVTGGSGYLAGWIVTGLLREGYKVRATLRSLQRQADVRAAIATQVAPEDRLSFVAADLLSDEGWNSALSGCEYAIHVASPMGQGAPKGTDLVGPARDGTLRVLKAAAANGVQRVVCTSSTIAAQAPTAPGEKQPLANEQTWTDPKEKGVGEYGRSKTLAEHAAWKFMEQDTSGMTLATVLPGMILGPVMTKSVSGSLDLVFRFLAGKVPALPHVGFCITDTQELVDLHLRAMTSPAAANERFIGTGDFLWFSEMAELLRKHFPAYAAKIPKRRLPDLVIRLTALFQEEARFIAPMLGKRKEFDSNKAGALLQWHARPSSEAVIECARSLIDQGVV
jgi:dihydroflavonol-4-reductase